MQTKTKKKTGMIYSVEGARPKEKGKYELRCSVNGESYSKLWRPTFTVDTPAKKKRQIITEAVADFKRDCREGRIKNRKQRQAEEEAKKIEEEEQRRKIQTFSEYVDKVYLPVIRNTTERPNTIIAKESALKNHLLPKFGNLPMKSIKKAEVKAFFAEQQGKGRAISTLKQWRSIMSDVFSDAIEDEIAEVNPTRGIKITGQRKSAETMEENHEFFSEEEMNYIWACAKKERLQVRLEIEIMSMTGCRVGELVALKWADVCLEKGKESITIAHSASSVRGRGMVIGPTKSGGARRISITIDTVRLIKEYSASKPILDINGYIFEGETPGKPISTASVRYHLKQMEKKYEIEGFHPHKLRHTYGSLAVQYGAPITAVSKALGHQDLSTTMEYYLHSDDTASKIVNNTLEKIRKIS